MGEIKISPDYNWFRSTVPLKRIIVDDDDSKVWSLYDAGPRNLRCPIIFLPPVSGTADVFFQQILALTSWGYRVISLQYPVYWDFLEFCDGFRKLLDHLQLDKFLADARIYAEKDCSWKLCNWPSGSKNGRCN
uniref:SPG21 abhydrolase domain containing, maspardin n=1 Tax=Callorhinchus milii TaxID=7868 RepID=A0A4W3H7S1_CALMI